jgi:predicted RNase H-like nuclease (RuvC/YqgF family)
VPEPQPPAKTVASTNPKKINLDRSIAKLEAEIRHNQRRIEQLQQQNARLRQKIQDMSRKRSSRPTEASSSSRIADRRRPKRNLPQRFWFSMVLICVCIAIVSAIIGFAVMRLMSMIK